MKQDSLVSRPPEGRGWYADWQSPGHVHLFDGRSGLSGAALVRNYESLNDVGLLNACLARRAESSLLEVGCATGEFYRYLAIRHPEVSYAGVDVSAPAIARAKEKYPRGRFWLTAPDKPLSDWIARGALEGRPEIVYSKDVLHHQTRPWDFLEELLALPSRALILRTRTRDQGETVLDPELSCQYHYQGWMPYIVFNLNELVERLKGRLPSAQVTLWRSRVVLGGRENRFLPKDCYLEATGTAETAVGVFLESDSPGAVRLEDRQERELRGSLPVRVAHRFHRFFNGRGS